MLWVLLEASSNYLSNPMKQGSSLHSFGHLGRYHWLGKRPFLLLLSRGKQGSSGDEEAPSRLSISFALPASVGRVGVSRDCQAGVRREGGAQGPGPIHGGFLEEGACRNVGPRTREEGPARPPAPSKCLELTWPAVGAGMAVGWGVGAGG